jgi:hypothetical protein
MKRLSSICALFVFAAALVPTIGSAQPFDPYYSNAREVEGVIASVDKTHIQLYGGRDIFLKDGTVINPSGTALSPGMHVFVVGTPGGNGAVNAQRVDVQWHGGYEPNNSYYGNARSATGVIAFVHGSHFQLEDGRNVFLKDGTVIEPEGATLEPGMLVRVMGSPGGDGAINAARVHVERRYYQ